ncbi:hypothetical protein [Mycobacteroides abscessus]|uniref:hypothetical protein n=1 Tax=Mycobacteroides abscessus TaxID=36809 RepID=UPI000C26B463|nr:hypothetical protein [Mycobacteroides abscessus]
MFFNFQDSDGTPLSKYRLIYADMLSINVTRTATNATAALVYNQADTYLASAALGVLSLMSSTDTVLSALGDVYHRVFGRIFEIVPPVAIMSLALMAYIVWAFVERRANIRSLAQDRNRIGVAVLITIFFSWLLRNPFYLGDRALNWIPNLVMEFLNKHSGAHPKANDGKGTGVSGYLMDAVVRPVTQSLMYGHPLTEPCTHDWSTAMNRGNAPACAPALVEAPQGAAMAAVVLGFFFFVLLVYGLVLLAMYVYHVSLAAWSWFSLLYFLCKGLFDVKAFVTPQRKIAVAVGHTLAAAVVNLFAVVGVAVAIAIVNSMTSGDPTFSVFLYLVAVIVLFFLSRQATGFVLRKTGAIHYNHGWFLNRLAAPPAMLGAEAKARRRETAADIASLTSRAASYLPAFPGATLIAAGAAALENRLRPGAEGADQQKGGASGMRILSDHDRETIDGATDVVTVGEGRRQVTKTVTWPPPAAEPTPPSRETVAPAPATPALSIPPPAEEEVQPSGGRHREATLDKVDSGSPAVFGGLGSHRLAPDPQPAAVPAGPDASAVAAPEREENSRARDIEARSAEVFADLHGNRSPSADSAGVSVDDLIGPMVRSYAPALPSIQAPPAVPDNAAPPPSRQEALRRSVDDGVKRDRARYVLAALGESTFPVAAPGDPSTEVYMYNDGTRNVVDPAGGEYVMGPRI